MTVSYQYDVASSTSGGFTRLLLKWKGSLYKLIYREFVIFVGAFCLLSVLYRNAFNEEQRRMFESLALYCEAYISQIPLSFVLSIYVSFVATRWWQQYMAIPWPDKIMHSIALHVNGNDDVGRMIRRTLVRYLNLSLILVLRSISSAVKRRFPTLEHVVNSGFMTKVELEMYQSVSSTEFNTYWIPCIWFINLLKESRRNNRIADPQGLKFIMEEFSEYRSKCGLLWSYDWVSIPLVYTQVVTIATYSFFIAATVGRQYVDNKQTIHIEIDKYIPAFTILQFFFYMGLLKVAEQLINPFGDDDEDFELNWLIDRHTKVSYLGVDLLMTRAPPLVKDKYFDDVDLVLPYTEAAVAYKKKTYRGSVADMMVPQHKQSLLLPEIIEEDDEEMRGGLDKGLRAPIRTSMLNLLGALKTDGAVTTGASAPQQPQQQQQQPQQQPLSTKPPTTPRTPSIPFLGRCRSSAPNVLSLGSTSRAHSIPSDTSGIRRDSGCGTEAHPRPLLEEASGLAAPMTPPTRRMSHTGVVRTGNDPPGWGAGGQQGEGSQAGSSLVVEHSSSLEDLSKIGKHRHKHHQHQLHHHPQHLQQQHRHKQTRAKKLARRLHLVPQHHGKKIQTAKKKHVIVWHAMHHDDGDDDLVEDGHEVQDEWDTRTLGSCYMGNSGGVFGDDSEYLDYIDDEADNTASTINVLRPGDSSRKVVAFQPQSGASSASQMRGNMRREQSFAGTEGHLVRHYTGGIGGVPGKVHRKAPFVAEVSGPHPMSSLSLPNLSSRSSSLPSVDFICEQPLPSGPYTRLQSGQVTPATPNRLGRIVIQTQSPAASAAAAPRRRPSSVQLTPMTPMAGHLGQRSGTLPPSEDHPQQTGPMARIMGILPRWMRRD